jgi:hypothetical protein
VRGRRVVQALRQAPTPEPSPPAVTQPLIARSLSARLENDDAVRSADLGLGKGYAVGGSTYSFDHAALAAPVEVARRRWNRTCMAATRGLSARAASAAEAELSSYGRC